MRLLLLISIAIIATCGLIYELVAGTLASYLLGDSVTQFSTVIGVYLFSMGVGSYVSKYTTKHLLYTFIVVEILVGLVGGLSSTALFILFNHISSFRIALYSIISITGVLVGLEIPLMMQILKDELAFSDLISKVFSFDYAGALLASLAFPLFFVPQFGLIKTSLFFGLMNVGIAVVLIFMKQKKLKRIFTLKIISIFSILILVICFVFADEIMNYSEASNYNEKVIFSTSSKYQRITITADKQGNKLYLNGNLQFYSADEYRYHEALVHPSFCFINRPENVLIMGGGDGCAAREVLKYESVKKITLVDLDAEMTNLFSKNKLLTNINKQSLQNSKLKIVNDDAFIWLKNNSNKFDVLIIDFPDPSNFSVGKLYTTAFYIELKKHLTESSIIVIQSTSPFVAPNSYWCIVNTLESVGLKTLPYHNYVPSFGEWGYVIASLNPTLNANYSTLPDNLKFFDNNAMQQMLCFTKDMDYRKTEINKLNNQVLVQYFEKEWGRLQ